MMSSPLLLGTYAQMPVKTKSISMLQSPKRLPTTVPSTFNFFEENCVYIEETNIPSSVPATSSPHPNTSKMKTCNCCPYGYHIDLDFIRYCEELAANVQRPTNEQMQRRNKRRQRKSLEVMLGFNEQLLLDYEQQQKQRQNHNHSTEIPILHETAELDDIVFDTDTTPINGATINGNFRKRAASAPSDALEEKNAFVKNILFDVCSDFERTLERASSRNRSTPNYNGSCIAKTNSTTELNVQRDRTAYVPRETHTQRTLTKQQNVFEQKCIEIEKTSIVNNVRKFAADDESNLSIVDGYRPCSSSTPNRPVQQTPPPPPTRTSPHIVSNEKMNKIQKQLVESLSRMNELEDRIRDIPRLQQELTTEKAENRDLHTKLKHMEQIVANMKREKLLSPMVPPPPPIKVEASTSPLKPFSPQRVCAMSLESLNFRFPNTSSPTNSVQSNPSLSLNNFSSASIASALHSQASGGHLQRNVACMTQSTLTRDIGIVTTTPEKKLTRSTASNTDVVHASVPVVHHVAVQCTIQDDTKKEYRNASTSTLPPVSPTPPTPIPSAPIPVVTHSIGVMAVPKMRSTQSTARPDVKSIGTENIHQKIRTRNHGTDPIVELIEPTNSSKTESTAFASISLKSLDLLSSASAMPIIGAEKPAKVIQMSSIGIQHVPTVFSIGSQCMERPTTPPPAPLPLKVCTDTASTDTCDLLLFRHRAVNTDAPVAKRDRPTNTEPIRTTDESTNTMATNAKSTTDIGTNPDRSAFGDDALHQCHNCLAKIEIKQQTIISNKNTKLEQQHRMNASPAVPVDDDVQSKDAAAAAADALSRIPRPTALISPRPDRKFNRQNTYTVPSPVSLSPSHVAPPPATNIVQCPAEAYLSKLTALSVKATSSNPDDDQETAAATDANDVPSSSEAVTAADDNPIASSSTQMSIDDDEVPKLWGHSMRPSPTYLRLAAASSKPRQKVKPSKEMQAALKVINDSMSKSQHIATTLKNANKIIQKEWFRLSSTETAEPLDVEDYLDYFEDFSPNILKYVVNMTDANGNTAMHYAVSHGNFDVVSILLDSKVCCINKTNNAGYTCVMLVSLAKLDIAEHQTVVQRLFQMADVNVRAKKHGQTALMLATSHGNYEMVRMLLEAGADINIQDEDGSTALMCAAEHGRMDIVKILLAQPDCDSTIQDLDGSSALKISLEAGYRDIGVLLYAHEYMTKNKSPYTSLRRSGRRKQSTTSLSSSTTALASGSGATAAVAGNSSATTSLHHSSLGIATSPTGRPNQR